MIERIIADPQEAEFFIKEKEAAIRTRIQGHKAIGFLSGGVDSSVVAVLGRRALGENLRLLIVETGLMRQGEVKWVTNVFSQLGIPVRVVYAIEEFFSALSGKVHPREKREAVRGVFYKEILSEAAQEFEAEFLLQGTNLTDIEATNLKSQAPQHNVLKQIGIDIGLTLIEPLKELRKTTIRLVAKTLGLPEAIWNRMPFLGPAFAGRIVGEVTKGKVDIIRKVTKIVEEELAGSRAFQYFPVLVSDIVPNYDRTQIGYAVAICCIDSKNAVLARPRKVSWSQMLKIRDRIYREVPEVFRVCWDVSLKPPAAVEWV